MEIQYLEAIKKSEGFTSGAKWDYAQYSNGYGTKAKYPGEVIDKFEAERRFAVEIASAKAAVQGFAPALDEGTTAALTSLTYNAGPGWMRAGLGAAIKEGDLEAAKRLFVQYVHAGGHKLAGLETRRAIEVQWIGQTQSAISGGAPDARGNDSVWHTATMERGVVPRIPDLPSQQTLLMPPAAYSERDLPTPWGIDAFAWSFHVDAISISLAARMHRQAGDDEDPGLAHRTSMARVVESY